MDNTVTILLTLGVILLIFALLNGDLSCPPQKIIYKYIPQNPLDIQFGDQNQPSEIYKDLFTKSSPWIGGFSLGSKAFVVDAKKSIRQGNKM
jgi:hypothetical protein